MALDGWLRDREQSLGEAQRAGSDTRQRSKDTHLPLPRSIRCSGSHATTGISRSSRRTREANLSNLVYLPPGHPSQALSRRCSSHSRPPQKSFAQFAHAERLIERGLEEPYSHYLDESATLHNLRRRDLRRGDSLLTQDGGAWLKAVLEEVLVPG